ncbi:MAG: Mov34/MPN/PAD-1 family protein [Bdellovibrionota bacterium]
MTFAGVANLCRVFEIDERAPQVLALRKDFPAVPHINVEIEEFPRSLCLYEDDYDDLKRNWTALRFLERIRSGVSLPQKGALHDLNQPLEPLLPLSPFNLIIPEDLISSGDTLKPLHLYGWEDGGHQVMFLSEVPNAPTNRPPQKQGIAVPIRTPAQQATFIHSIPRSLQDLHDLLIPAEFDLIEHLRGILKGWMQNDEIRSHHHTYLWLIISVPLQRIVNGPVEKMSTWAFMISEELATIGEKIGVWQRQGQQLGYVMVPREYLAKDLPVCLFNPIFELSRNQAGLCNGEVERYTGKIVGIGMGALGSQVFDNLVRSAFGEWTVIDKDIFLPHNGARHALPGIYAGWGKATAMSAWANNTISGSQIAKGIVANVTHPKENASDVSAALDSADLILDMSASVAVARYLACDSEAKARRCSLFLSPSGTDLVLLAESSDRSTSLDILEMQYYRQILSEPSLDGHLGDQGTRIRYARTCRDVTAVIAQDLVAMHSAIGSRAIKNICRSENATIAVWRVNEATTEVTCSTLASAPVIRVAKGDWEIRTDQVFLDKVFAQRVARLPNETGGVLVGSFDNDRKLIYVVDMLPSPPDSIEWPTSYIRGYAGLRDQITSIQRRTLSNLSYVGEWHSHPQSHPSNASADDLAALTILADNMKAESLPAVMLIVGENDSYTFLVREAP